MIIGLLISVKLVVPAVWSRRTVACVGNASSNRAARIRMTLYPYPIFGTVSILHVAYIGPLESSSCFSVRLRNVGWCANWRARESGSRLKDHKTAGAATKEISRSRAIQLQHQAVEIDRLAQHRMREAPAKLSRLRLDLDLQVLRVRRRDDHRADIRD